MKRLQKKQKSHVSCASGFENIFFTFHFNYGGFLWLSFLSAQLNWQTQHLQIIILLLRYILEQALLPTLWFVYYEIQVNCLKWYATNLTLEYLLRFCSPESVLSSLISKIKWDLDKKKFASIYMTIIFVAPTDKTIYIFVFDHL